MTTYSGNHKRVARKRGRAAAQLCMGCCGKNAHDWALIHGKSGEDPADYVALCKPCHFKYDEVGLGNNAARGRPLSAERRAQIGEYWKGRPKSPEHRAKISAGRRAYYERQRNGDTPVAA